MKVQLEILYRLQQLEHQKNSTLSQKAKVDADEVRQLWQEIRQLTQNIAANRQALSGLETVCAGQETEIAAAAKQCQQVEAKLYGGEITNLKEMEQTKENCDRMRKDIGRLENEAFSSIEACEQVASQITADEAMLLQKKRQHTEKQQVYTQALAGFDRQLAELEAEHHKLAGQVDAELMTKYRDLGRRIPVPIAKLVNGACSGCRRSIPTNQMALSQTVMIYCDNCGRILLAE